MERFAENPLITPADVIPSRDDFKVVCAFNCGAIRADDEILLLLRVAERPEHGPDEVVAPILNPEDPSRGIELLRVKVGDPDLEIEDSRVFQYKGASYLTSISHMRLARSKDGRNFTIEKVPAMFPGQRDEEYGIEDPRITRIDDTYYVNYSAISRTGIATGLAKTSDFKKFERLGIIFAPDNRDVTILPEKVGGRYVCYHRPIAAQFSRADIWMATSPDLIHWGENRFVMGPNRGRWDGWRVGGGAVPIKSEKGWLSIYHAADADQRYCLGALLTDLEQPERVIGSAPEPILSPDAPYEREGFFGKVVFSCGAVAEDDGRVIIYYGAADERVAAAETHLDDLVAACLQ